MGRYAGFRLDFLGAAFGFEPAGLAIDEAQ
jgi:hypothetical protein